MQILFRQTRKNRFTLPVLCNLVETWDGEGFVRLGVVRSLEEALQALTAEGPTLLGYSFMTPHLDEVAREARVLRDHMGPNDLLAAGGAHATADPEGTLGLGFHAVVVGEGEEAFPRILDRWSRQTDRREFPPVWRSTRLSDLQDSMPVSRRLNWMAPLEISRGCPHGCGYCFTPRIHPLPVRHRTMASIERYLAHSRELERGLARFIAPDAFAYRDPEGGHSTLESLENLLRLCRERGMAQVHLGYFPSEVRPDRVHPALLDLILRYCTNRKLVIGAQSGSDRVLGLIRRGHSVAEVERAVAQVVSFGLLAHVDMIFGLPGEVSEDRLQSLRLMERLMRIGRTKIHAHVYLPLPGTPLFPLPPSQVEPWFIDRVRELQGHGALDGEWETQAEIQQRILEWRERGIIRV